MDAELAMSYGVGLSASCMSSIGSLQGACSTQMGRDFGSPGGRPSETYHGSHFGWTNPAV